MKVTAVPVCFAHAHSIFHTCLSPPFPAILHSPFYPFPCRSVAHLYNFLPIPLHLLSPSRLSPCLILTPFLPPNHCTQLGALPIFPQDSGPPPLGKWDSPSLAWPQAGTHPGLILCCGENGRLLALSEWQQGTQQGTLQGHESTPHTGRGETERGREREMRMREWEMGRALHEEQQTSKGGEK